MCLKITIIVKSYSVKLVLLKRFPKCTHFDDIIPSNKIVYYLFKKKLTKEQKNDSQNFDTVGLVLTCYSALCTSMELCRHQRYLSDVKI